MELAYTIEKSIELHTDGRWVDLHNDYDLVSALCEGSRASLHFVKRTADWVKATDPDHLALVFEQVDYFERSQGTLLPTGLPTGIEEIGFKEPEDSDLDWLMGQPEVSEVHILFRLYGDEYIRIGAVKSFLLANRSAS